MQDEKHGDAAIKKKSKEQDFFTELLVKNITDSNKSVYLYSTVLKKQPVVLHWEIDSSETTGIQFESDARLLPSWERDPKIDIHLESACSVGTWSRKRNGGWY